METMKEQELRALLAQLQATSRERELTPEERATENAAMSMLDQMLAEE